MSFYSKWDNGDWATAVVACIAVVSVFGLSYWGFEQAFHEMYPEEDELGVDTEMYPKEDKVAAAVDRLSDEELYNKYKEL
jgi:hypothetical protein